MNVLLLYPEFPDTFWSFKHALKFISKRASFPPLGLLTMAAMLPRDWNLRLADVNVRKLTDADLAWADMVFVGAMIAQRDSAHELIHRCREAGKVIVAGGPLFTAEHEQFPEVDHFVLNEAEVTLPGFLDDLARGEARHIYTSPEYPDLALTPEPLWHLADLKRYASMSIQFSRGCPFDCDFCNVTALFGRLPRVKTPERVIAELDSLYKLGWRGAVFFVDDNLIGNKKHLRELLPALIAWRRTRRTVKFHTQASINLADDAPLMQQMVDAGFYAVFIGIETPDDSCLTECNKRQNRGRDMVGDVKRIQRAGLQVQGGFIVGFDGDTPGIFQRQIDFIQKSGIVTAMVGLLNAMPATRLYDRMKSEGRLLGESTGNNVDGTMNFVPRMDASTLHEGYEKILDHIYAPKHYYRRLRVFLREYHPPRGTFSMSWQNLRAFVHSTFRLGLIGRERFQYWQLLGWTLVRRPALFEVAVTLAIYGHHFRKTCAAVRA